jgi:hypothetical protein
MRGGFGTPEYHRLLPVMTELVAEKTKSKGGSRKTALEVLLTLSLCH